MEPDHHNVLSEQHLDRPMGPGRMERLEPGHPAELYALQAHGGHGAGDNDQDGRLSMPATAIQQLQGRSRSRMPSPPALEPPPQQLQLAQGMQQMQQHGSYHSPTLLQAQRAALPPPSMSPVQGSSHGLLHPPMQQRLYSAHHELGLSHSGRSLGASALGPAYGEHTMVGQPLQQLQQMMMRAGHPNSEQDLGLRAPRPPMQHMLGHGQGQGQGSSMASGPGYLRQDMMLPPQPGADVWQLGASSLPMTLDQGGRLMDPSGAGAGGLPGKGDLGGHWSGGGRGLAPGMLSHLHAAAFLQASSVHAAGLAAAAAAEARAQGMGTAAEPLPAGDDRSRGVKRSRMDDGPAGPVLQLPEPATASMDVVSASAAAATEATGEEGDGQRQGSRGVIKAVPSSLPGTKAVAHSTNKQLTSRFRGVCWNKKNRRWQAAINSGGKYLYLGSFLLEDDAARAFDRAAIKLRNKKAKVNFHYKEYVDAEGNLLEDVLLPDPSAAPGQGRRANKAEGQQAPMKRTWSTEKTAAELGYGSGMEGRFGEQHSGMEGRFGEQHSGTRPRLPMANPAAPLGPAMEGSPWDGGLSMPMAGMHGMPLAGGPGGYPPSSSAVAVAGLPDSQLATFQGPSARGPGGLLGMPGSGGGMGSSFPSLLAMLPQGCSLENIIPGRFDTMAMLYRSGDKQRVGSAIWDGETVHNLGTYGSEQDASQAAQAALNMLVVQRQPGAVALAPGPAAGLGGALSFFGNGRRSVGSEELGMNLRMQGMGSSGAAAAAAACAAAAAAVARGHPDLPGFGLGSGSGHANPLHMLAAASGLMAQGGGPGALGSGRQGSVTISTDMRPVPNFPDFARPSALVSSGSELPDDGQVPEQVQGRAEGAAAAAGGGGSQAQDFPPQKLRASWWQYVRAGREAAPAGAARPLSPVAEGRQQQQQQLLSGAAEPSLDAGAHTLCQYHHQGHITMQRRQADAVSSSPAQASASAAAVAAASPIGAGVSASAAEQPWQRQQQQQVAYEDGDTVDRHQHQHQHQHYQQQQNLRSHGEFDEFSHMAALSEMPLTRVLHLFNSSQAAMAAAAADRAGAFQELGSRGRGDSTVGRGGP